MFGFFIRLVGYAFLLGLATWFSETLWSDYGLDGIAALQPFHDAGILTLRVAPLVLALAGIGRLRDVAVFAGFFLAGAALTAPFVCARVAGA